MTVETRDVVQEVLKKISEIVTEEHVLNALQQYGDIEVDLLARAVAFDIGVASMGAVREASVAATRSETSLLQEGGARTEGDARRNDGPPRKVQNGREKVVERLNDLRRLFWRGRVGHTVRHELCRGIEREVGQELLDRLILRKLRLNET
jgi:hypothetical protein